MQSVDIRRETLQDREAIGRVVWAAFVNHPHSRQTEHLLVEALREAQALAVSLVAEQQGEIIGHVAFSEVKINALACGWFGLGPVAVRPDCQRRGIGSGLVRAGLAELQHAGARGCVVLGSPAYYCRFGFAASEGLSLSGAPSEHFMALTFVLPSPQGQVTYHSAFDLC
jgi:putative acetyltransferase